MQCDKAIRAALKKVVCGPLNVLRSGGRARGHKEVFENEHI